MLLQRRVPCLLAVATAFVWQAPCLACGAKTCCMCCSSWAAFGRAAMFAQCRVCGSRCLAAAAVAGRPAACPTQTPHLHRSAIPRVDSWLLQLLGLYLAGGLAASMSHVLWYWWKARNMPRNPWGSPSWAAQSPAALGASGAVNAIVVGRGADDLCVFHVLLPVSQPGWLPLPPHCNEAAGASSPPFAAHEHTNGFVSSCAQLVHAACRCLAYACFPQVSVRHKEVPQRLAASCCVTATEDALPSTGQILLYGVIPVPAALLGIGLLWW